LFYLAVFYLAASAAQLLFPLLSFYFRCSASIFAAELLFPLPSFYLRG
jgi:hypothetical protein